jgi:hypothetical protein
VLQDQHPEDYFGGGTEPAAARAPRIPPRERGNRQVDEFIVLKRGIDPLQNRIPEFVAVGQQHFKHAALPMGATDHGTSHEVSQSRCMLRELVGENITNDDGAARSGPSTKLRVQVGSDHRAQRKHRATAIISAPESS